MHSMICMSTQLTQSNSIVDSFINYSNYMKVQFNSLNYNKIEKNLLN